MEENLAYEYRIFYRKSETNEFWYILDIFDNYTNAKKEFDNLTENKGFYSYRLTKVSYLTLEEFTNENL